MNYSNSEESEDFRLWHIEHDYIRFNYDRAYYKCCFCSEKELPQATEELKIWRHKYFNS